MTPNKINILSTRPVSEAILEEASRKGITIDILSFIDTENIDTIEVQQEIEQVLLRSATVIFTSMNAVEAVAVYLEDQQPDWTIYTLGNTSQELVNKYFGDEAIAGTASNATELAELIAEENQTREVVFFCGDQRRNELPDLLKANDIDVYEIEVYRTIATPHRINKPYEGILFFSPSAVESFFSNNTLNNKSILFAIGDTTANSIKKYTNNKIIIGEEPGKENLVREMMEFFGE